MSGSDEEENNKQQNEQADQEYDQFLKNITSDDKRMPKKISFKVVHVSGQDDNFKAQELNVHSPTTKGWQSSRFCLYPQDIVVQLDKRVRLRKIQLLSHQYLIATKIEFYVGDVPEGAPATLQNARYTRLGYVALSGNEKTNFKARELKSVHVDANGLYVKFVIHKNHINKHNLYNQVGIIAINVIGDDLDENEDLVADNRVRDPAMAGILNRPTLLRPLFPSWTCWPDYISPLDDLAFDMYQDPEVAQIIRKLEKKKQEAVLDERYDYAKKIKQTIQDLQKAGEKLGKYDIEKRQAVENEDYDKAKLKKIKIDEYRLQVYKDLDLMSLINISTSPSSQINPEPKRQATPPRLTDRLSPTQRVSTPPLTPYEDKPLPAIKNKPAPPEEERQAPSTPYEERLIPALKNQEQSPREEPEVPPEDGNVGNVTGEAEGMSEKDQREAAMAIEVFGLSTVSKIYSKTWSFREDGLSEVQTHMNELGEDATREDAKTVMRQTIWLLQRVLKDKVYSVFVTALNMLRYLLGEFNPKYKIPKGDTSYAAERTLPVILQRSGDTAVRIRDAAKAFVIEVAKMPEVKPTQTVPAESLKPFKLNTAPRNALNRTEIVDLLYKELTLSNNSGVTLEGMMTFCTNALQHTNGEVREKAEKIIIELYKECGAPVKGYLPPDDDRTRKNVLYKHLFEAFDRIDGKPTKNDIKKQKVEEEQAKEKEIHQLQKQLKDLRDMQAGKKPVDKKAIDDPAGKRNIGRNKKKPADQAPAEEEGQIDHTCIFCGETDESFTEDGLDFHYWKTCPMLKRCTNCKQVVEIAGFTDHLLTECNSKDQFKQCSQCSEAVPLDEFEQHDEDKTCLPAEKDKNRCPLCHLNIPGGEDGWKIHLMENNANSCKANPRKPNKAGLKGRGKSQLAGPSNRGPKGRGQGGRAGQGRTPRP